MTKKLKLAIVLLVTIASMNVNAQKKSPVKAATPTTENTEAKPTKQQTMDWIAGKMKENLGSYRTFISYVDGKFVYKKPYETLTNYCTTTIDLNKITGMNSEYSEDFYVTGKGCLTTLCDKESNAASYEAFSVSGPNYSNYSAPFNFTPDQSLVERLKKAVATLIEYNSTKKGAREAF
ncbi:hypothetical protein [Chryseobacterium sp. CFBP8996]|uniref:hypothetical protein n=1 Tax=Chryseobacterium sp. CFBP8996 TaxID=3096529 RepID=UPI002A6B4524|nr:hypothetical protein [Chryseobacterium sp. CFBP8996]MDY0931043.1 hypothetical protein [Chryseobacterium sp. CFBP8996]